MLSCEVSQSLFLVMFVHPFYLSSTEYISVTESRKYVPYQVHAPACSSFLQSQFKVPSLSSEKDNLDVPSIEVINLTFYSLIGSRSII